MELVEFVLTTTYFTSNQKIYQQKKGVAMGSPLSPVAVNIFMEWLEEKAIDTALTECKPKFWKRYVDDILEIIDRGQVTNLTDHLNQVDTTGSIKCTYEEEIDGAIPFLDTKVIRKPDGSIKLDIYRKPHQPVLAVLLSPSSASEARCRTHPLRSEGLHHHR